MACSVFGEFLTDFGKNAKRKFLRMSEFFVLDVFDGCFLFHYHRRKVFLMCCAMLLCGLARFSK